LVVIQRRDEDLKNRVGLKKGKIEVSELEQKGENSTPRSVSWISELCTV
jgi:hypothetical protein